MEIRVAPVVLLTTDPMVVRNLKGAIETNGGQAVVVDQPTAFADAVDGYFPVVALVDLTTLGDWQTAIHRCKLRPHTRQIPIYAFGTDADGTSWQAASQAGADYVWTRSKLMTEIDQVVDRHINPPTVYPAGWDDQLSDLARQGLAEFNRGEYFEQHELLEEAWMAEERPIRDMYQGILQVGVAFYQIERNNWHGALKMFRRGLPKLRALPAQCQGINIAAFRQTAEAIHSEVAALGPENLSEFDQSRFPRIEYE